MAELDDLLLAIWRDVSRHLDIGESIETAGSLLRKHIPFRKLSVARLDDEHQRVRTVAAWPIDSVPEAAGGAPLSATEWGKLIRWTKRAQLLHRSRDGKEALAILQLIRNESEGGDWILAPLVGEHGSRGVLHVVAGDDALTNGHSEIIAAIQEAMGVALDNDARLHELAALRDAAEADRQSLLRRLGRSDVVDAIIGEDAGLAPVMERVGLVSRSEVPVLILGETGTGKELVARAIHNRSGRHSGPFLRVNCGAIPRELIDSQLFGHEKGAFTGANELRQGWFERADRGTLFLDEIGELPLDAQVRFLRVLQDGYVERVGGAKPIRVDVRVVAATHRDLAAMVRERTFREDLWYRIAVFPILLPPLRDRLGDIAALARHFAKRAAIRFGLSPVEPSEADIELLQSYEWPGNIRELGAVIDRAAILGNGDSLELAAALGVSTPRGLNELSDKLDLAPTGASRQPAKIVTLDEAMRGHIEAALRSTRGRVEGPNGAARLLAINPHTLRARMRKLKISWSKYRDGSGVDEANR